MAKLLHFFPVAWHIMTFQLLQLIAVFSDVPDLTVTFHRSRYNQCQDTVGFSVTDSFRTFLIGLQIYAVFDTKSMPHINTQPSSLAVLLMESLFLCPSRWLAILIVTLTPAPILTDANLVSHTNLQAYTAPFSVGTTMSKFITPSFSFQCWSTTDLHMWFSSPACVTASTCCAGWSCVPVVTELLQHSPHSHVAIFCYEDPLGVNHGCRFNCNLVYPRLNVCVSCVLCAFITLHHMRICTCLTDPQIFLMEYYQGIILLGLESYHVDCSLTGIIQWHQCNINAWQSWFHLSVLLLPPVGGLLRILLVALRLLMSLHSSEVAQLLVLHPLLLLAWPLWIFLRAFCILWPGTHRLSHNFCIFHRTYRRLQQKKDEPPSHACTLYSCFGWVSGSQTCRCMACQNQGCLTSVVKN